MRIKDHPVLSFNKGKKVEFYFNGKKLEGYENETIASSLHAAGIKVHRKSIELKRPRGLFCAIGKCSSCLMQVNGISNTRICVTPLKANMKIISNWEEGKNE